MLTINFGNPGCGKTTLAVRTIANANKKGLTTACNFGCTIADYDNVDLKGLGDWTFDNNTVLCIDEAGIEYNNRLYKTLAQSSIKWFKKHLHYIGEPPSAVHVYSQSWEDVDCVLRRLADRLYYFKKIGPFTYVRRIYKDCDIDRNTRQIIDGYDFISLFFLFFKPVTYVPIIGSFIKKLVPQFDDVYIVLRRPYYKYFDTHEKDDIPIKYPAVPKTPAPTLFSSIGFKAIWRACANRLRGDPKRG